MAYGYEKGFVIVNINRNDAKRKRVNCKDCINYVRSDHSCMKRPLYMPVDGYSNWKNCQYFCLSDTISNYGLKKEAVRKQQREKEFVGNRPQKTVPKKKTTKENKIASEDKDVTYQSINAIGYIKGTYLLVVCSEQLPKIPGKKRLQLFVKVSRNGKIKYVPVAYDADEKRLYINKKTFDFYRPQFNSQQPIKIFKTFIDG
jgi:hypothetical protein